MRSRKILISLSALLLVMLFLLNGMLNAEASSLNQMPTVDIATVTGTPSGVMATVKMDVDQGQVNVRSGPGTFYDKVGVLLAGQKVPAKGKSVAGEWIMIEYPGVQGGIAWIYSPLVDLSPGNLSVVEPPPTPTPLVTPTINPTLAAQFVITSAPTRLPSFTPPPPLAIPTFTENTQGIELSSRMPVGLIILGLAGAGILIGLFTVAQR
jgi:uncharacterized protein YraI